MSIGEDLVLPVEEVGGSVRYGREEGGMSGLNPPIPYAAREIVAGRLTSLRADCSNFLYSPTTFNHDPAESVSPDPSRS